MLPHALGTDQDAADLPERARAVSGDGEVDAFCTPHKGLVNCNKLCTIDGMCRSVAISKEAVGYACVRY
jgi:hypothetical protein